VREQAPFDKDKMAQSTFNPSYVGPRPDIERLIPRNPKIILDVGCSTGTLGVAIKASTGAQVFGIELSEAMANEAIQHLDRVFVGDAAEIILREKLGNHQFSTIIFADVLEHLVDPWAVLKAAATHLETEGTIIASIPNIRHIDTLYNLVFKGYWPYRDRGIHDRTHLRFFTKKNILELFEHSGLVIETIETNYRFLERPAAINRFAKFFAVPIMKDFLAFQYLIRASLVK
jgi:2-polyprenyl-3-methyl-5-hydroxy-6-metoxy-1,4-benzoquinol methylase